MTHQALTLAAAEAPAVQHPRLHSTTGRRPAETATRALDLPRMSAGKRALHNGLLSKLGDDAISFHGLDVWPIRGESTVAQIAAPTIELLISFGRHHGRLALDQRLCQHLLGDHLPASAIDTLPSSLRIAVFEAVLDAPITDYERALGQSIVIEDVSTRPAATDAAASLFFGGAPALRPDLASASLSLDDGALSLVCAALERLPDRPRETWHCLPVPVRFEVGSVALHGHELRGIEPGDVLIPDECTYLHDNRQVRVRVASTLTYAASLDDDKFVVVAGPVEDPMTDRTAENPKDLDELSFNLAFDLGETTVPLKTLKTVGPGHTFVLDGDAEGLVQIRMSGKKIGTGELVRIDDRIGVRVQRLFGSPDG